MHTEHLQNVSVGRVVAGWLVAAAVTSLVALVLVGSGIMNADAESSSEWWSLLAVLAGFFAGGFFTGFRAIQAPVLHALFIGLATLVAWAVLNAITAVLFADWDSSLTPELAIGLLLTQFVATALGSLLGYNVALRGKPGLSEHEPA